MEFISKGFSSFECFSFFLLTFEELVDLDSIFFKRSQASWPPTILREEKKIGRMSGRKKKKRKTGIRKKKINK
jgi:hypothetical protein